MAGRVAGKVAFITGAARGQGRSHAIRLAEQGADIVAVDICRDYRTVPYPMATAEDLAETVKVVQALDRRIVAAQADVRDAAALKAAVDDGVARLGRLDIVVANAGNCTAQSWDEVTPAVWQDTLDTNLTGVWNAGRTMAGPGAVPGTAPRRRCSIRCCTSRLSDEQYRLRAASPHLRAEAPRLAGKLAGPAEVIVLQAVPAGDPGKGRL
jgi:NAD(P)-dependent dehydrogenase (short-subunit alcohol dehydrogenase family)